MRPGPRTVADGLRSQTEALTRAALVRMEEVLPWYRATAARDRSWISLVAQAGITAFITWYEDPSGTPQVTTEVFGSAPRELTSSVSLQKALDLVRTVVDVVEEHVAQLAPPGEEQALRESVLRYSREVAFAAAQVYARAAEARGAWDARLEALVVDALVRGEADDALRSRAAALGWPSQHAVAVLVGTTPAGPIEAVLSDVRRQVRQVGGDVLVGVQGDRLVIVLGRAGDPLAAVARITDRLGPGPVVTGPVVSRLSEAGRSARAAIAGLLAARAWPSAPRPVAADDLLPERVLAGDSTARRHLVDRAYRRLQESQTALLETAATYLELGRSLEATARALFVHPNTVRYRLNRVTEVTGWDPTQPREGYVLHVAIALGRLAEGSGRP